MAAAAGAAGGGPARRVDPRAAQFDPRAAAAQAAGFAGRLAGLAACLVALPLAVYVASYADYFASGHTLRQWLHLQGYMATFNWNVQGSAAASSRPLTWIFDATPIWYRWAETPHGVLGLIAIGNPLLWWGSIAAFVGLLWLAWKRRDVRLAAAPLLVAILYLPWLATSRQSYIYYLTPVVPFLAIMVATALARLAGPAALPGRWAAFCFAVGAVLMGGGRRRHARLAPGGAGGPGRRAGGGAVRAAAAAHAGAAARSDHGRRRTTRRLPGRRPSPPGCTPAPWPAWPPPGCRSWSRTASRSATTSAWRG